MASAKRKRILAIVATDRTFERRMQGDEPVWVGKCIFCGRNLIVAASGQPISRATIEHIWPRTHGGDDRLENLALACSGCNREKGQRHDSGHRKDSRFLEIVEALREKRRERWREPAEELAGLVASLRTAEGDPDD
jgi:5-methylcytosine-specific restriction endonuclease McrA